MRGVPLLQAVLTLSLGFAVYRPFWLGALAGCAAVGWSCWLTARAWPTGDLPTSIRVGDAVVVLAVMLAAGAAIPSGLLTTSFYWPAPLAQAVLLMAGLSLPAWASASALVLVLVTYGAVVGTSAGAGSMPVAGGNAAGIVGYYALGAVIGHYTRRLNRALIETGQRADQQQTQLGVLHARAEEFGRLHDDAVQVLERVAAADEPGSAELRAYAALAARRLRGAISDQSAVSNQVTAGKSLLAAVSAAAEGFAALGFLVTVEGDPSPCPATAMPAWALLTAATIEALNNSCKHSGATGASVTITQGPGTLEVTVADNGMGFDAGTVRRGFGLASSVFGRLEDAGGGAALRTAPGAGTTVRMWLPC
jgi:hypothetical protein